MKNTDSIVNVDYYYLTLLSVGFYDFHYYFDFLFKNSDAPGNTDTK